LPAPHLADLGEPTRLVPLTVWAIPTPAPAGVLPPAAAARAIATFSQPGDLVLTHGGPGTLADAANYLHRRHRTHDPADPDTPRGHGRTAGLVIDHPTPTQPTVLLARFAHHVARLRPGGFLLTVHSPAAGPHDPLAAAILAAQAAGLRYLQHLIVLAVPITGGRLAPPPAPRGHSGRLLVPAHLDVAVFTTPGGSHA